jgi:hypothetical protein
MNNIWFEEKFEEDLTSPAVLKGYGVAPMLKERMGIYYLPNTLDAAHAIKAVLI